jgi:hypothetical protein
MQRILSRSDPHVPSAAQHSPCAITVEDFYTIKVPAHVLRGYSCVWDICNRCDKSLHYAGVTDVAFAVNIFITTYLNAMGLYDVRLASEFSLTYLRSNIPVITYNDRPIGVIVVKKPTLEGRNALLEPTVIGELYDQMQFIKSFYNSCPVCGILTTGAEWMVCWYRDDNIIFKSPLNVAALVTTPLNPDTNPSSESSPTRETPSLENEKHGLLVSAQIRAEESSDKAEITVIEELRELSGTRILSMLDDKDEAVKVIYSALLRMTDVASNDAVPYHKGEHTSSYVVFLKDEPGVLWHTMSEGDAHNNISTAMPAKNTKRLLALADLGRGASGIAYLTRSLSSTNAGVCVLKISNDRRDDERVKREYAAWGLIYPQLEVRLEKWTGSLALLMPHFSTVLDDQKDLIKDDLKKLLQVQFHNRCKVHSDVEWRNIGYNLDAEGKRIPVLFDLDAVVDYSEEKHMNWIDDAMEKLYSSL